MRPRLDPVVADLRRRVRAALHDLEPGDLVLVACSGGPDSLALAAVTCFEAGRAGYRSGAVVVDHDLQKGSAAVSAAVASTLRGLGTEPVEVVRVDAGTPPGGPEGGARRARYAALGEASARLRAAAVLLGHTLDDQAETVLLGLARGSGARSLAGMRPVNGIYRRPFLGVSRHATVAACRLLGLEPWQDPHNEDSRYQRVRVRRTVLPVLESELGPGIAAALSRTAELLAADADALDALARDALADCSRDGPAAGRATLAADRLIALPGAVRSRVLRLAALGAGCPAGDLTAGHITALEQLLVAGRGGRGADLPGRVRARRDRDSIVFAAGPVAG